MFPLNRGVENNFIHINIYNEIISLKGEEGEKTQTTCKMTGSYNASQKPVMSLFTPTESEP